jgi:hypothetical protein
MLLGGRIKPLRCRQAGIPKNRDGRDWIRHLLTFTIFSSSPQGSTSERSAPGLAKFLARTPRRGKKQATRPCPNWDLREPGTRSTKRAECHTPKGQQHCPKEERLQISGAFTSVENGPFETADAAK